MKGVFINCPYGNCKKLMIKNAYLRPGSFLTLKCFHCGQTVVVNSESGRILLSKQIDRSQETLQNDEIDDIVFMSV